MGRLEPITDADLLDFVEGRLSSDDRAIVAKQLAADPVLERKCQRVREQTLNVRLLRAVLPVESIPADWLALLNQGKLH
jgi:anti-sigma factor RsiW